MENVYWGTIEIVSHVVTTRITLSINLISVFIVGEL